MHCKMSLINGNEASFLIKLSKIENYPEVPTPFAKKYLEKSNNSEKQPKIILKTKSGVEREVKYFKIKNQHYFLKGWPEFVKDTNLQNGDSLIFFLINSSSSNLIFEVFVYAQNGCSKNTISPVIHTISDNSGSSDGKKRSIEELEASDDDDHSSKNVESPLTLTKVVRSSYMKFMQLSKRFVKEAGINGYQNLQLENDEGKKWKVDLRKWGQKEMPHIVGGWSKFLEDNKVEDGNSCDIFHVKDNVLRVHVYKERKKGL